MTDSFDYVVTDGTVVTIAVTVTLTVNEASNTQPTALTDNYSTEFETQLVVSVVDGLLANDTDADGDELIIASNTDVSDGTLSLQSDGSFIYTPNTGFVGNDSFSYTVNDGTDESFAVSVQIIVGSTGNSVIDTWYGLNQSIGNIGQPQTFANVLGNVSDPDGIASLSYTLNGGPSRQLTIGPDGLRLDLAGDFNVDLNRADLTEGNNLVEITAIDNGGSETSTTVNLNYSGLTSWPEAYQIDWSQTSSIQDVV